MIFTERYMSQYIKNQEVEICTKGMAWKKVMGSNVCQYMNTPKFLEFLAVFV
jgi:hypothetical protein